MNADKVNGYGVIFRFITPILVTVAIFLLGLVIASQNEIKTQFSNHLEHHRVLEVNLESRLSRVETKLDNINSRLGMIDKLVRGGK